MLARSWTDLPQYGSDAEASVAPAGQGHDDGANERTNGRQREAVRAVAPCKVPVERTAVVRSAGSAGPLSPGGAYLVELDGITGGVVDERLAPATHA